MKGKKGEAENLLLVHDKPIGSGSCGPSMDDRVKVFLKVTVVCVVRTVMAAALRLLLPGKCD